MAILDIRGTHGSGKSHIVHTLLEQYRHEPINENNEAIGYYIKQLDCAVVGRYANVCGGCDGVGTADEVVRRVRLFAESYSNVILEGIIVSHTFTRYNNLAQELGDKRYKFLFLNTPLKSCEARVRARRSKKGNTKEFNPTNLRRKWSDIWSKIRKKCVDVGRTVVVINYRDPMPQVLELLRADLGNRRKPRGHT